jgi:hypothetical protein
LFLFAKRTNPNQSNRRSMIQSDTSPLSIPCVYGKRRRLNMVCFLVKIARFAQEKNNQY